MGTTGTESGGCSCTHGLNRFLYLPNPFRKGGYGATQHHGCVILHIEIHENNYVPLTHQSQDPPSRNYCWPLCRSTHFQPYPRSHLPCPRLLHSHHYYLAFLYSQSFFPSMVQYYFPSKLATILKHIALPIDG